MKKTLEKISNHFTNADIQKYYKNLEKKYPDFYKENSNKTLNFEKQKNKYSFLTSVIPNIGEVCALAYVAFTQDYIYGPLAFGACEGLRASYRSDFKEKKRDNLIAFNEFYYKKEIKPDLDKFTKKISEMKICLKENTEKIEKLVKILKK